MILALAIAVVTIKMIFVSSNVALDRPFLLTGMCKIVLEMILFFTSKMKEGVLS